MQINELFAKDIQRSIEGVIKADDTKQLSVEVDEYVLTDETVKALEQLLDRYNNNDGSNGVWISGFFGSGKSHLLKMLAHLLGDVPQHGFDRAEAVDAFQQKAADADEMTLQGAISKSSQIPATSILFNIDQKASAASVKNDDSLLAVFVRVFDEACGYYGKMPHVAQFERDLDSRGELETFKSFYAEVAGRPWEDGRSMGFLEEHNAAVAYARLQGVSEENPVQILSQYSDTYRVTAEDFAQNVKTWLDAQESPQHRINFFVDEVGQFIANNVKLMLKLQTVAETLMTVCGGRSWVFVTSQESMDSVLGDKSKQQTNDFSKIQARFQTRLKLSSQDVEEVISKRLLRKNEAGAGEIRALYAEQHQNLKTLFDFHDGSRLYGNYKSEEHFVALYPFTGYQLRLFQSAIEGLSQQNAFEGRNSSVGERSMLGVVQDVAKQIATDEVGTTVSFDRMYEGIKNTLQSSLMRQINAAETELDSFAVQVLKALFLVKYVDEFKASEHNIVVLMYPGFGTDISALQANVKRALRELEQKSFIQRTGDLFEYLTNAEKDIEQKIKNVDLEPGEERKEYLNLIAAILGAAKMRDAVTGRDFPFTLKVDDTYAGTEKDLSINFLTPLFDYYGNSEALRAHSVGKDELRVVLQPDDQLNSDIRLYIQTNKYVKRSQGTAASEDTTRALTMKTQVNQIRAKQFRSRLEKAIEDAILIDNGSVLEGISASSAKARIELGFSKMAGRVFTMLGQLGDSRITESTIRSILSSDDSIDGIDSQRSMEAAAQTMLGEINRRQQLGESLNVARLVAHFEKKPYGWDSLSTRAALAVLVADGKVSVSKDSHPLKRTQISEVLTKGTGFDQLWLDIPKTFSETEIQLLKEFVQELDPNSSPLAFENGEDLAERAIERIKMVLAEVRDLAKKPYPYVPLLAPLKQNLEQLDQYSSAATGLYKQGELLDDVLEQVEQVLSRVRGFMNGAQHTHYDAAKNFLVREQGNLSAVSQASVAELRDALAKERCFDTQVIQKIRQLQAEIDEQILRAKEEARSDAFKALAQEKQNIESVSEWSQASESVKQRVEDRFQDVRKKISNESLISSVQLAVVTFQQSTTSELVGMVLSDVEAQQQAASEPLKISEATSNENEEAAVEVEPAPVTKQKKPVKIAKFIKPLGGLSMLQTPDDIEQYLQLLKQDLERALDDDQSIMLF